MLKLYVNFTHQTLDKTIFVFPRRLLKVRFPEEFAFKSLTERIFIILPSRAGTALFKINKTNIVQVRKHFGMKLEI